jgi:Flp pilus assembly protein TadD
MYEAHLGLGEVLEHLGERQNAIAEIKLAERAGPDNPRPHYLLSQIYRKAGEKNLAAQEMANFQRLQALAGPETAVQAGKLVPLD